MSLAFSMTDSAITVFTNGRPFTVGTGHINFHAIKDAIKREAYDEIPDLVDVKASISKVTHGKVEVREDGVYYDGKLSHTSVANKIMELIRDGFSVDRFVKFMDRVMQNPKHSVVQELFDFLQSGNVPITEDGKFLAYKKVRHDYKDVHSGTMDNRVGQVVEMARNEVDDDRHRTCSSGLHVCTYGYLNHFGGDRIVICEVDPADVVAVPVDYGNAKMRVCRYKVVGELEVDFTQEQMDRAGYDDYSEDYSEDYEDDYSEDYSYDEPETYLWTAEAAVLTDDGILLTTTVRFELDSDDEDDAREEAGERAANVWAKRMDVCDDDIKIRSVKIVN